MKVVETEFVKERVVVVTTATTSLTNPCDSNGNGEGDAVVRQDAGAARESTQSGAAAAAVPTTAAAAAAKQQRPGLVRAASSRLTAICRKAGAATVSGAAAGGASMRNIVLAAAGGTCTHGIVAIGGLGSSSHHPASILLCDDDDDYCSDTTAADTFVNLNQSLSSEAMTSGPDTQQQPRRRGGGSGRYEHDVASSDDDNDDDDLSSSSDSADGSASFFCGDDDGGSSRGSTVGDELNGSMVAFASPVRPGNGKTAHAKARVDERAADAAAPAEPRRRRLGALRAHLSFHEEKGARAWGQIREEWTFGTIELRHDNNHCINNPGPAAIPKKPTPSPEKGSTSCTATTSTTSPYIELNITKLKEGISQRAEDNCRTTSLQRQTSQTDVTKHKREKPAANANRRCRSVSPKRVAPARVRSRRLSGDVAVASSTSRSSNDDANNRGGTGIAPPVGRAVRRRSFDNVVALQRQRSDRSLNGHSSNHRAAGDGDAAAGPGAVRRRRSIDRATERQSSDRSLNATTISSSGSRPRRRHLVVDRTTMQRQSSDRSLNASGTTVSGSRQHQQRRALAPKRRHSSDLKELRSAAAAATPGASAGPRRSRSLDRAVGAKRLDRDSNAPPGNGRGDEHRRSALRRGHSSRSLERGSGGTLAAGGDGRAGEHGATGDPPNRPAIGRGGSLGTTNGATSGRSSTAADAPRRRARRVSDQSASDRSSSAETYKSTAIGGPGTRNGATTSGHSSTVADPPKRRARRISDQSASDRSSAAGTKSA